jgi:hypothetical protein
MKKAEERAGTISDPAGAAKVSEVIMGIAGQLNESIAFVMKHSPPEEFSTYRLAVATVMGEMLLEILNPLYKQHPALMPPQLD